MSKHYYMWWSLALLVVEVCIALFIKGGIIRHFVGDILAVILLYCLLRWLIKVSVLKAALLSLSIACLLELAQYFKLVSVLKLEEYTVIKTVLGSTADLYDLLAYAIGTIFILIVEKFTSYSESKRAKKASESV